MKGTTRQRLTRNLPRGYFSDAPECAKSSSPELGSSDDGVHGTAGGVMPSTAAGNQSRRQLMADSRALYESPAVRKAVEIAQQLHAARVISGRAQG